MELKANLYDVGEWDGERSIIYKVKNRFSTIYLEGRLFSSKIVISIIRYSYDGEEQIESSPLLEVDGDFTYKQDFIKDTLDDYRRFRVEIQIASSTSRYPIISIFEIGLKTEKIISETAIEKTFNFSNFTDSNGKYSENDSSQVAGTKKLFYVRQDLEELSNIITLPNFTFLDDLGDKTELTPRTISSSMNGRNTAILKFGVRENG